MKKILKWGVIVIAAIIFISVISGGDESPSTSSEGESSSKTEDNKEERIVKIRDEVIANDLAFTVTDISQAKSLGSSFTKADAQGTFNVVTLTIKNVGKETVTIDSSMMKIIDSEGRKFDRSVDGQTAKGLSQGKVDLFLQQVQPGLSVTGDLVFDLPDDATDLKLIVKGSMFGTEKQISLTE